MKERNNPNIIGVVHSCNKLNVREAASADSPITTVIEAGTKVKLLSPIPNNGYYKVQVDEIKGYCLGTYIDLVVDDEKPNNEVN